MKRTYLSGWWSPESPRGLEAKVVLLGLFLSICANGDSMATEKLRSFEEQPSLSTEPISLQMGSTRLVIPRNHLTGLSFRDQDSTAASVLAVAVYPGFEGATADNINQILRPQGFSIGAVYFTNTLERSAVLGGDNSWTRRPWYQGPGIELEPAEYGLLKRKDWEIDMRIWLGATDAESVAVGCGASLCQIHFFAEGFLWRVQMSRNLYSNWQDVTRKLKEFIAACASAADSRGG